MIEMNSHGIGPKGAHAIAASLEDGAVIEVLHVRANGLLGEGAEAIAKLCKENAYLTDVDLSDNALQSRGLKAIGSLIAVRAALLDVILLHSTLRADVWSRKLGWPGMAFLIWMQPVSASRSKATTRSPISTYVRSGCVDIVS